MSFKDLGLSPEVLRALEDAGYQEPTPIQEKAIPTILMGRDVLGGAQTGTGKTAGFTLPMLDILASGRARARMPRSLIIEPTRELAAQVAENFDKYGKYGTLTKALLIGGESFVEQEKALTRGVDVLIATPGRLLDLFERGKILLADVKIVVIDESDRMLDMGFIPDVERIVKLLPKIRQTLFFSATMPPEIRRLADSFLMNPKEITVSPPTATAEKVTHKLVRASSVAKDKRATLRTVIKGQDVASALIFCNRKRDVGIVYRSLERHGFNAAELHGDMAQPARMATLKRFKDGEVQLLVCSDVAARGLDIPQVSHVFNFDVPINAEDYIHRIGRTGRAGRSGDAFTLVTKEDGRALAAIQSLIGQKIGTVDLDGRASEAPAEIEREDEAPRRRSRRRGDKPARERRAKSESKPREEVQDDAAAAPPVAARKKKDDKVAVLPNVTTKPFGDHTPAFILKPLKLAASA
ncbi:MAG: DEAD/DEAH box helicase [Pseudomonadota bacterium]